MSQNRGGCRHGRSSQVQYVRAPQNIPQSQNTTGQLMTVRPVGNMRPEIRDARLRLQRQYEQEAQEAEEKRKRKEQQKREAWLKRQEALVSPGQRLGSAGTGLNYQRDLLEQQECLENYEWGRENVGHSQMDEHYAILVQQRKERERERAQFYRNLAQPVVEDERGVSVRSASDGRGRAPVPSMRGRGAHSQATTPEKPDNFLGVYQPAPSQATVRSQVPEHVPDKTPGRVLGYGDTNFTGPLTARGREQPDHREQMLAARMRMQQQYDAAAKRTQEAMAEELKNVTERLETFCSK